MSNRRGFGRFARELVAAMAEERRGHEMLLFVDAPSRDRVVAPAGVRAVHVDVGVAPSQAASADGRRSIPDMLAMGRAVAAAKPDVFFFPATYTFYPVWSVGRVAVTLHDMLALLHPEWVFPTCAGRWAWWLKERLAVATADLIVTVSRTARRDICRYFGLTQRRVRVIGEAADAAFTPEADRAETDSALARRGLAPHERFLLYVGGFGPHKNIRRLLEAFAGVAAEPDLRDVRLVLVGDYAGDNFHSEYAALRDLVGRHGLKARVLFTGFVPDDELRHMYARCRFLVFPSMMEGFGLPAVEAMACGAPVASSTAGSLPEVVGAAGRYFSPTDVEEMRAIIVDLLRDERLRGELASRALCRSKDFSWCNAARTAWDAFERLATRS